MRLKFSDKQNEYIASADRRWGLKIGAVRSGKSFVDIAHVVPYRLRALKDEAGLNVILGVSKETIERNVLQPMREIYTDKLIGTINSRNIANVCGVDVYCLGAEKVSQVAKIQGSSIKYCYGDEIAKWNKDVFAMLQSRLDKPYSRFDGSCNPEYPGHWLKDFIDNPEIDAYIQKYTIFDNPFLPKEFVDNLCKEYAGTVYYKRYILGEWALAEGLIYPMYETSIEKPPDRSAEKYIMSLDYGTQNAFAAILWGKYGDVWYALREYYYSGRDTGTQKTDDIYLYTSGSSVAAAYNYKAMRVSLRYGYDFHLTDFVLLTPQAGMAYNHMKGTEIENYASEGIMNKMNTMSGLLAVRLTTVLNNHFRIQITPEFDFGIYEDDNFKSVKGIDDQLKSWTTGLNLNVGLQVFF